MKLIANVDKNFGIGYKNNLLVRIPADMKYFRATTTGNVVVMGRKTLESFPNQAPLPDRTNIVLTSNMDYTKKGAIIVHSEEELLDKLSEYNTDDVYIIGGESIYRQFLDRCDLAYLTKVDYGYEADAFFPNLDENEDWELLTESEEQTYFDVCYTFCTYRRKG